MPSKFELITKVYYDMCKEVVRSPQAWQRFLESACHNYRLRFDEQLLVFAQRPDATAVLEFEKWNRRFGRHINRGAKGIAVFENVEKTRIKHYFDISDTSETEHARPVPIWKYKDEYEQAVIGTLENTFGELEHKDDMIDAVISAADNATEDNTLDYISDLVRSKQNSFLEELDDDSVSTVYRTLIKNSVAYMILSRLGISADQYFGREEFAGAVNFNTPETLNAVGFATSDIAEIALNEVSKTVLSLEKSDRIIAKPEQVGYTETEIKNERSVLNDRTHIQNRGRSADTESDPAHAEEFDIEQIWADEKTVSQGGTLPALLQSADNRQTRQSSDGDGRESENDGAISDETDGGAGGLDGGTQSNGSDGLGAGNEQSEKSSTGDRAQRSDLRPVTDELPPFLDDDLIMGMLANPKDDLVHRKSFVVERFHELSESERKPYTQTIYGGRFEEYNINNTTVGLKSEKNGLLMYKGTYKSRTEESVFSWDIVAELVGQLIDEGNYLLKEKKAAPAQISLFDMADIPDEQNLTETEQVSFFTDLGVSQQIIDEALCIGANDKNSTLDIAMFFRRDRGTAYNAAFLKRHYGTNGTGFLFQGEHISVWYDESDIKVSRGDYANRSGATLVTWEQAAKRIRELLDMGRYMPQESLDKIDDRELSVVSKRLVTFVRDMRGDNAKEYLPAVREITDNIKGGYPEEVKAVKELLSDTEHFDTIFREYDDFQNAVSDGAVSVYRYGYEYSVPYVFEILKGMRLVPLDFKAAADFAPHREYFITEDEIKRIIRGHEKTSEFWLATYAFFLSHPDENDRVQYFKDHYGWQGSYDGNDNIQYDAKGLLFSHGNLAKPYAKAEIPWKRYVKYVDDLIAGREFLSQEDLESVDDYERKQVAKAVMDFWIGVPFGNQKPDFYNDSDYWNSVEKITGLLESPEDAEDIQKTMLETSNAVTFEERYRDYEINGLKTIEKYVNGTYTCFGDKSRTINPLIKVESKPAEKDIKVPEDVEKAQDKKETDTIPAFETAPKTNPYTFDLHPEIPLDKRINYNFAEKEIETVGKKERFRRNVDAINVLKACEFDNRFATPEEQETLSNYVGWGGIPEPFDENNDAWADEFKELYVTLSPEEYETARKSTLTAFYTPQPVISAIYKVMENLGFKQGNILEPCCAIGNFIGMLPESMKGSKVYGIEIDNISAGIAQQLYQFSSVMNAPFEKAVLPDSFFDAVVGNVPFGDYSLADKRYDKYHFLIHDYFFAKSLDKLRPGGVMCLVTSKGTMDKESTEVRRYIAQRAELLGAIRLPDNTFKSNAGTEVTSDILILQKRDRIIDIEPNWIFLDEDENGIRMNKYFVDHPDMVLGEMVMQSGRFKPESACKAYEDRTLEEQLEVAVQNIKGEIREYTLEDTQESEETYIPADPNVRNFSYTVVDGQIYFRENSVMREVQTSETAKNRIKGMIEIRDCVKNLLEMQTEDYSDAAIETEQRRLNEIYDTFVKKYEYINSRGNASAFSDDSSYFLICSLEIFKDGEFERKADMFTKRTIQPHIAKTHADTSIEAYGISIGEKAKVDMPFMCELTGKNEEEISSDLKGVIFLNPAYDENSGNVSKYLPADEYLSGNVRTKLREAKRLSENDERFMVNAQALEKVQPVDLKANEIEVHLGVTWLPLEIIDRFMYETFQTPYYTRSAIKVHYNELANVWNITNKSADNINLTVTQKYGTSRKNAFHILEATLNLRNVRVFDYEEDENGKRVAILNKKETAIALAKQELIKQTFKEWIWKDPERREKLCKLYNEKFNSIRPREYDGSHIVFEGMNPEITLRTHQKNAVARGIYGGNTLLAHCVGAGKTYTMAAIAQESKRLGLCSKSLFVVPNHLVSQWASEYLTLYPSAKILAATKKDFETKNRKKFCARIATGDYDAVIIGHSQFEKIPVSIGRQMFTLQKQIDELVEGIAELKQSKGERFTVKQLEATKIRLESKLQRLNDQSGKDDVVTFEELGVDRLFVDEAHYYKNLFVYSKMKNVGGISQIEAHKSSDMFMKCQYLDELTESKGITFATGTPISNSMVELYTMQRYLQYDLLKEYGYVNFDSWAAQYGETVTAVELTPEGTGYRTKVRFARFNNLPELMAMFKECADIQTSDMLKLPVPKANYHNISVKPSEMQKEMVANLGERAEKIRAGTVKPYEDNMLNITNDGRKLALDQRLINPSLPDYEGSKVNACISNIYDIWKDTADQRSTQLVFCDLSTPTAKGTAQVENNEEQADVFTNVYDDIRRKLIVKGIPAEEIAFIHSANNDRQKAELFAKVRSGKVRILLGSTQKMGAGTNVQDRLIASHDIDCPWRPSDLEQRAGRIIRQGNSNPEVHIYRYVTENTFDAYLYQLVETKQKFVGQVMTSKTPVRSIEDVDEAALSYAEIKMLATGNPHIKEKMDLDIQVQNLRMLQSNYYAERYALEDKVTMEFPRDIARYNAQIKALEKDIQTAAEHPKTIDDCFTGMVIGGVEYADKKKAGNAILQMMKSIKSKTETYPVGSYRGFTMEMYIALGLGATYVLAVKGAMTHKVELGTDAFGNLTRIDNCIDHFEADLQKTKTDLAETEKQLEIAKESLKEPFSHEQELQEKQARLNELNALLNVDKKDNEIMDEEPEEDEHSKSKKEIVMCR